MVKDVPVRLKMLVTPVRCPECGTEEVKVHSHYRVQNGEERSLYYCPLCDRYFSQTYGTAVAGLRTPLSRIQTILDALNAGLSINAVCRTFKVSKNTVADWLNRLSALKEPLLLYALCHQFLQQIIEGDERYTKVERNVPAMNTGA